MDVQNPKQRILVVDDATENLDILVALLQKDYRVTAARSGQKALVMAAKNPPDLILLDIMMPEMDGYEVCRHLKQNPELRFIPVIFITAMTKEENETQGLELGAVDYINKPIQPAIVQARVKTHLRLKQAYEELEEKNRALKDMAKLREDVDRITRHDLKTPLTGIIGLSSLLSGLVKLEGEEQKMLIGIEQCGYQMLEMINRSLDLYKMETDSYQYQPVEVDVLPILRKLTSETEGLTKSNQIRFEIALNTNASNDAFIVIGEELLCYSMLANLVKNALEASPPNAVVRVSLSITDDGMATICIHNQGAVPESIRNRFFEKYVTAGKSCGTGLGTYSAKLIANTLQGDIWMETSAEKGTFVTIMLPSPISALQTCHTAN